MNSGGFDREVLRALGLVFGIGAIFMVSMAVGLGLGLLVSWLIGGGVLVIAGGLVLGAVGGGYGVYRAVMQALSQP